jgi:CheY-like chemotaxis protein
MPEMSGRELAESLAETRPDLRVLYISGYAAGEVGREGGGVRGSAALEKPFTPEALVRKVREVLDGSGPA